MAKVFVTGTDTDVGKTYVSALLCESWGANYWKPVQTGLESDLGDTNTVATLLKNVEGFKFGKPSLVYQKPLSPWRASVLEGRVEIDITKISIPENLLDSQRPLIIEGAGGAQVPLNSKHITTDLVKHFDVPVIIVSRSGLGTLNHTLLTVEHFKNRGVKVLGVIMNGEPNEDNIKALESYGVKILCQIPIILNEKQRHRALELIPRLEQVIDESF